MGGGFIYFCFSYGPGSELHRLSPDTHDRPVRGLDAAPAIRECTFAGFMKCNLTVFLGTKGAIELRRWFEKTESVFGISECVEGNKVKFGASTLQGPALTWWNSKVATMGLETVNRMPYTEMKQLTTAEFFPLEEIQRMEHEMVEPESVKIDAYIRGLSENIKGEVTSSRPTNLNEPENFQSENNSGKSNHKDNSCQSSQNNQKQGNARAMTTALTEGNVSSGSLPVCERCFTRHVGPCKIKCHKCGKVGNKSSEKVVRIPYGNKMLTVESDKGTDLAKIPKNGQTRQDRTRDCEECSKAGFKDIFVLDRLCHLAILCLDHHAHTVHHLESLLTISLDRLDILKEDLAYQSLRKSLSLCLSFLDS
uniref:Reverse transcriptase domain-containing protein n=1 Tax=Tanacetum cinerariifolium TaxID=118510 RepID=A0A6L2NFP2_TANCI|nr:hypothetical protein [Tanacetum cinerariifolium]